MSSVEFPNWYFFLQLILAVLFGGLIGGERQIHGRPAGLRTHILVCLGSAVIIISFQYLQSNLSSEVIGVLRMDPARAAAGIITGIGFLGAGTIVKGKNFTVGLTTAASIWVVAAIGITLGLGQYIMATAVTILVLLTLYFMDKIKIPTYHYAEITVEGKNISFDHVRTRLIKLGIHVKGYRINNNLSAGLAIMTFVARYKDETLGPRVVDELSDLPGMISVSWK